jgi:hypothetical protein
MILPKIEEERFRWSGRCDQVTLIADEATAGVKGRSTIRFPDSLSVPALIRCQTTAGCAAVFVSEPLRPRAIVHGLTSTRRISAPLSELAE